MMQHRCRRPGIALGVVLLAGMGAGLLGPRAAATNPQRWARVTVSVARLRAGATTESEQIGRLVQGARVRVLTVRSDWCQVAAPSGTKGWVAKELLQPEVPPPPPRKLATIAVDSAHIRSGPSPTKPSLGVKSKGTALPVLAYQKGWLKVRLAKAVGWIRRDLVVLKQSAAPATKAAASSVRGAAVAKARIVAQTASVRGGPGDAHPRMAVLNRGQTVYIFGRKGNWVRVRVHGPGTEGWVAGWLVQVYGAPRPAAAEPKPARLPPPPADNCPPGGG